MGPTEARLMDLAWKRGELTVKQALFDLDPRNQPAYTTVKTILTRLTEKGLLTREKSGRSYVYRPALERATFVRRRVKTVSDCIRRNFKTTRS